MNWTQQKRNLQIWIHKWCCLKNDLVYKTLVIKKTTRVHREGVKHLKFRPIVELETLFGNHGKQTNPLVQKRTATSHHQLSSYLNAFHIISKRDSSMKSSRKVWIYSRGWVPHGTLGFLPKIPFKMTQSIHVALQKNCYFD